MTILVTGGCGFLGQSLLTMLSEEGHNVVSYDRRAREEDERARIHYVQGDLNDLPRLLETIEQFAVTGVIHTAAISHPYFSRDIPFQTVVTNALGTTSVFEACRLKTVKRVVNFSSECAYGDNAELALIDEDVALNPTTPYGATKVFTEKLASVYNRLYGMRIISLRPGWIYGPGQFMQCYLKTMLRNAIDGRPTVEPVGRDYRFQYVHVTDVARASILALNVGDAEHEVFNITGDDQRSYAEVAELVRQQFNGAEISIGPGTIDVLDQNAQFAITRAREELDYRPLVPLPAGIESYAEWLRNNPF